MASQSIHPSPQLLYSSSRSSRRSLGIASDGGLLFVDFVNSCPKSRPARRRIGVSSSRSFHGSRRRCSIKAVVDCKGTDSACEESVDSKDSKREEWR